MVTIPGDVVSRYPRFSLYNSPYPAHDEGRAVDLYPATNTALSPVAGEVVLTRTVRCPSKPYAAATDHLIVVDTGDHLARVLHVDPSVEADDRVRVGDALGEMVRSGFFAPWVDNHIHLGFREQDADPVRASGSLPVDLGVEVAPARWDGTGTVVETGETYAILDDPAHPAPGERFAGLATDDGLVLDGGFPHYSGGGVLGDRSRCDGVDIPVSLLGTRVGVGSGRTVTWNDITVSANGSPIHGLSLFCGRDELGVKLVCPDAEFAVGEPVSVTLDSA